jgi:branched-chain amino acid transport system substrate-binding protein
MPSQAQPVNTAVIAAPLSLTGEGERSGQAILNGLRLAVEEALAAEPELRVRIEELDDRSNDDAARSLADQVAAGPAVAVIGPSSSTRSLAAGPAYAVGGLVSLPANATSDVITQNATTFRVVFKNNDLGEMLALYLARVLNRRAASVVVIQNGYGATLQEGFVRTASRLGLDVNIHPLAGNADAAALEAISAELLRERERAVVLLTLEPEGARLLARLRRGGHNGPFLGGDSFGNASFGRLLAGEPEEQRRPGFFTDQFYALAPVILDSANAETLAFARRFRARFGQDPVWQAVAGYDAGLLTLAAIRRARAAGQHEPAAMRAAVREYLKSLNEPARAEQGLLGPFWFDANRGRQQGIRVGRFRAGNFESAPLQIVAAGSPDAEDIAAGAVFDLGDGRFGRLQRVVHTGVYINEFDRVDTQRSSFGADFYFWLRFAGDAGPRAADPTDILFPTMIGSGGFDSARPSERRERADGTQYWLWRVKGEFQNDFDLHRFPFDSQELLLPFFNARAANDRIVYVIDRAGPGRIAGPGNGERPVASPEAFRNVTEWIPTGITERRESLVTSSLLGDLDRTAADGKRELSGFVVSAGIQRQAMNTLINVMLPLLVMSLITFASLFFPPAQVMEKVSVAITGALSGAVLLDSLHSQLGNVGYTVVAEYVFYANFALALLSIIAVLVTLRLRSDGREGPARVVDRATQVIYFLTTSAVVAVMISLDSG